MLCMQFKITGREFVEIEKTVPRHSNLKIHAQKVEFVLRKLYIQSYSRPCCDRFMILRGHTGRYSLPRML